mmetsp:Transcript_18777/g.56317  ORF Transcript_18777/g.56317 Transcript_18777/m.56317 type:complete len:256 (+) Transcript_18777:299-1066(+)
MLATYHWKKPSRSKLSTSFVESVSPVVPSQALSTILSSISLLSKMDARALRNLGRVIDPMMCESNSSKMCLTSKCSRRNFFAMLDTLATRMLSLDIVFDLTIDRPASSSSSWPFCPMERDRSRSSGGSICMPPPAELPGRPSPVGLPLERRLAKLTVTRRLGRPFFGLPRDTMAFDSFSTRVATWIAVLSILLPCLDSPPCLLSIRSMLADPGRATRTTAVAMASTGRWLDKVDSEQWVGAELSLRPRPPLVVFD